jgi:VWFA-related protein
MRKRHAFAATLLTLSMLAQALAQTPAATHSRQSRQQTQQQIQTQPTQQIQTQTRQQPTPAPSPDDDSDEGDVVRITTNLVQFDAVAADKKGQQVTDLRPEDFEVTVDGRRQPITNFSYIVAQPGTPPAPAAAAPRAADKGAPFMPPARVKPGDVRRTVALVVDDLGASFESTYYIRRALKKFVDEQMQPGDLVAIMRTSAGMGALQQFTSDRNILYHAIERVRWYPTGRGGVGAFAPLEAADPVEGVKGPGGARAGKGEERDQDTHTEQPEDFREQVFSVGTLGALNFIVRGMRELPGRKSVVMFSDGFEVLNRQDPSQSWRVIEALRRLVDQANRAAVVVYTVDARGLPALSLTAADNVAGRSPQNVRDMLDQRRLKYFDTQDGLNYLAEETGGLFLHDTNDLGDSVRRVLDDQRGYYLIGFRPDEAVFRTNNGRSHFNDLGLKVKRPGVKVRYRSGFMGVPDSEVKPARETRLQQMIGALSSPFSSGDLPLRLTSLFGGSREGGAVVASLMHIDMRNVKFADEADGWKRATLDVIALTFGDQGNVVDSLNRVENVRVRGETYERVRRDGLVYQMQVPVKKPGAYQLRVAVRDSSTEKLGSASQFIEVPDLKKDRLALSGIVLQSTDTTAALSPAPAEGVSKEPDPGGSPAVRRFRAGEGLDYFFNIYNARVDKATGKPRLQTQMRLFRDQEQIFAGAMADFDTGTQTDFKNLHAGARIRLNSGLAPGEYVLQIVVNDALAPQKRATVTQWIDFEVVK